MPIIEIRKLVLAELLLNKIFKYEIKVLKILSLVV